MPRPEDMDEESARTHHGGRQLDGGGEALKSSSEGICE